MSLLNHLFGNASEVNINELKNECGDILIPEEEIVAAFRIFRDKWVFTNKRLIMLDVRGVTGSKRDYHSVPYNSINHFSVETSGTFDGDCEMKLWIRGASVPIEKEFKKGTDLKGLQRILAKYILK